jgi:hypothetical protein
LYDLAVAAALRAALADGWPKPPMQAEAQGIGLIVAADDGQAEEVD